MGKAGDRARRRRLNKLSYADWLPHDRGFVSGLPQSRDERRSGDRLITGQEDSPPWPCLQPCAPCVTVNGASLLARPFGFSLPVWCQTSTDWTISAMAQMKPTISRAIAVVTTTFGLPAAERRRYRAQSRSCAFQATARTAAGNGSRRS